MRTAAHHQHGQHRNMSQLAGDASANDVGQSTMSMRRHGDEIALLTLAAGSNLLGGITTRQNRFSLVAILLQIVSESLDVLAVASHLFRLTEVELIDVSRCPAVRDVDQHDRRIIAGAS